MLSCCLKSVSEEVMLDADNMPIDRTSSNSSGAKHSASRVVI